MSRFVACNYGADAYDVFNQALCDHQIRDCNAPLPLDCETCGNGIREGGENCDGLDLTVDETGVVPQCSDFPGYIGGTLACTPMCELDFTACQEEPPAGTSTTDEGGVDDSEGGSSASGGQVGEDGCACTAGGDDDFSLASLASIILIALRRRRFAAVATVSMTVACGPSDGSATSASSAMTESGTANDSSSGPEPVEGWPDSWYGQYYEATDVNLGVPSPSSSAFHFFYNVRLDPGAVRLDYFDSTGEESGTVTFTPEVGVDGLVILPVEGQDYIEWPPFETQRASAEIRPGADCSGLEVEQVRKDGMTYLTALRRGRICLVVPHNPNDLTSKVTVDLCTDDPSPTTCDS